MPLDVDAFVTSVLSDTPAMPLTGVSEGAINPSPVEAGAKIDVDFRDMAGLKYEADSAFFDAIQRGADNSQGSLFATANAIGKLTGLDGLAEFGEAGFREQMMEAARNPAHVQSFEDIDGLATLGTYIAEAVGENLINMGMMATGGGLGVKAVQASIGKAAVQNMSKQAASRLMKKAAVGGAAVPGYGLGAGEVQGEFIENGIDAPGTALLAGIPIAGLDVFGLERIISTAFKGAPVTGVKDLLVQAAKGFGLGAGTEMPTEAAQEFIGIVARAYEDPSFELFTEENAKRLMEAGIKGGLAGGAMAGGGVTVNSLVKGATASAENKRETLRKKFEEDIKPEDRVDTPAAGPTAPEPTETLQAGVDAIGRGGRLAAYSADPAGFDNVAMPEGSEIVRAADGGAYLTSAENAFRVQKLDRDGKQAEILGYPNEKPADPAATTVVQAKDAQGRTVQDVATDPQQLELALEQGAEAAGPGGTVEQTTAEAALAARSHAYEEDDYTPAGPGPRNQMGEAFASASGDSQGLAQADPEDLIGALTDEAMLQEPVTVTAKHSTTERVLKKIYGGTSKTNTDGSRDVTLPAQDPRALQGDPVGTHPLVVKAMSKVFDDGRSENRGQIELKNPHPTKKNEAKGVQTFVRASLPAILRLGGQLNRLNDTESNQLNDLASGLAHLMDLGFIPAKITVMQDGKPVTRELNPKTQKYNLLPLNAIVDGRGDSVVTYGDLRTEGKSKGAHAERMTRNEKAQAETVEAKEEVGAKASDILKRIAAARKQIKKLKRNAHPFAPESDEAVALQGEIKALYEELKGANKASSELGKQLGRLRKNFNDMREMAQTLGLAVTDGQFDPREIQQEQEAKVTRGARLTPGKKVNPGNTEEISAESVEDTRGLPTDKDQAKESSAYDNRAPAKGRKRTITPLAHRGNKVSQYSTHLNEKLVDMAGSLLQLLGIKQQVVIADEDGLVFLIDEMKAERKLSTTTPERAAVLTAKIQQMEHTLTLENPHDENSPTLGRVLYMDEFTRAEDRVPVIFVSMNNTKQWKQMKVLSHELGHLLQRVALDQAPKDVQAALRRALSGTGKFEENFANQLWRYMMELDRSAEAEGRRLGSRDEEIARQVLRTPETKAAEATRKQQLNDMQIVKQFFGKLAATLRKAWDHLRKNYGLNQEYKEFVDALFALNAKRQGQSSPETRLGKKYQAVVEEMTFGPFMPHRIDGAHPGDNFTLDDVKALANTAVRHRRAQVIVDSAKGVKRVWDLLHEKALMSADTYLRSLGPVGKDIAAHFHHVPGTKKVRRTTFEEVRNEMGQQQVEIDRILSMLPTTKKKGYWNRKQVDTTSSEYTQLMDMLMNEASMTDFQALPAGPVRDAGIAIRQYMDAMFIWSKDHGTNLRHRKNYFPQLADVSAWMTNKDKILAVFRSWGYPPQYGDAVFKAVTEGDGYLADILQDDDKLLGPSFKFMHRRRIEPNVMRDLQPYMVDDLGGILQFYTHSAIERGVIEQRFGLTARQKHLMEGEFRSLDIIEHLNSPVAKLHYQLARALRDEQITPEQYRTVKNKILEAYFGRLGANIDPRWQKFQSVAVMYQNVRLLSLATLTAIVDPGQVIWRSGHVKHFSTALKVLFDSQSREELMQMGRLMGTVQDSITEHVLNDQTTTQFMSPKMKHLNEKFFRLIGMHQWTNLTRVMGLAVGREFLKEHAAKARQGEATSQRHLEELGVTPDEIDSWFADGMPTTDGAVVSALNTFVDEAIVRPDATVRPTWGSDRNWQIFFHLKSFMWGYHEVILKRIWNRAQQEPDVMRKLMAGGLSAAALVAMTLPLAAAGYELRRKISWWGSPPAQGTQHGMDYLFTVAQRSGYLGLFQFIADADQAADFGKLSILSAAGPSMGQLEEFLRNDFDDTLMRGTPFLAQSGAARSFIRDAFR